DRLLNASDQAEARRAADLAHLAKETQILDQLRVLSTAQIIEELIERKEQAAIRVNRLEGGHHLDKRILCVRDLGGIWELEAHPELAEAALQRCTHDVAERHLRRSDFGADHMEASGDRAERFGDLRVR